MYCTNCGAELKDGAKFCHSCGATTKHAAERAVQAANAPEENATTGFETSAGPVRASSTGASLVETSSTGASLVGTSLVGTSSTGASLVGTSPTGTSSTEANFTGQMGPNSQRSNRKLSLLAIVALVLVLVAGVALAAVFITTQADTGKEPVQARPAGGQTSQAQPAGGQTSQAQPATGQAGSSEQEAEEPEAQPERELTDEERAIASLDGWWQSTYHHERMGFQICYGNVHDGVIDWYRYDPDVGDVSLGSTVAITRAERFSENGAEGWRFFTDTSSGESWAYYEADGHENELPVYKTAFGYGVIDEGGYNMYSPERYGMNRVNSESPGGSGSLGANDAETLAKAQKLAEARASESAA